MKNIKKSVFFLLALAILLLPLTKVYANEVDLQPQQSVEVNSVSKFFRVYRYYSTKEDIKNFIFYGVTVGEYYYSGKLYRGKVINVYVNGRLDGYEVEYSGTIPGYPKGVVSGVILDK